MSEKWISSLRVTDLKDELKKRGLAVSGKKAELAERLTEAVSGEAPAEKDVVAEETPEEATVDVTEAPPEPRKPETKPEDEAPAEPEVIPAEPEVIPAVKELPKAEVHEENSKDKPPADAGQKTPEGEAEEATDKLTEEEAIKQIEIEATEEVKAEQQPDSEPEAKQRDEVPLSKAELTPEPDVKQQSPEVQIEADPVQEPKPEQKDTPMPDAPQTEASVQDIETDKASDAIELVGNGQAEQQPDPEASPVEQPKAETPAVDSVKPQGNLAAMQAALLAPESTAVPVPETAEEEELVDFEADEVMEEPPSSTQPQDVSKGVKRASVEPATVPTTTADKLVSDGSTPSQAPPSKRQRQPIPSFKSLEARSTSKPNAIPSRASQDDVTPAGRKTVFDRVGAAAEEVPRGSGAPPSRVQATTALLVTGFVRPFTVKAAQGIFEAHGKVVNFWMPMIRDKACVVFESVDSAEAARQALHGLEWPKGSRTSLRPKFISEEEAEQTRSGTGKDLPARGSGLSLKTSGAMAAIADAAAQSVQNPPVKRKSDKVNGESAQPKRAKVEAPEAEEKKKEDVLTLEDLFRKTEALPHLYWLPVSAEVIAANQKAKGNQKSPPASVKPEKPAQEEVIREEKKPSPVSAKPERRVQEERPQDERNAKESRRDDRSARDSRHRDDRRQSQR